MSRRCAFPSLLIALGLTSAMARPALADTTEDPPAKPLRLVPNETTPDLVWDSSFRRFTGVDAVTTGVVGAGAIAALLIPVSKTPWRAPDGFDEGARGALRLGTLGERNAARDASDLLLTISITYPFFVDALATAYWSRKSRDVALQMAEIDVEALAFNAFASSLVSSVTSRERPYGRECPTAGATEPNQDCATTKRYRSFFSGHTSSSFTSAGLVCTHHAHFALFGGGFRDVIPCLTSLAAAATVGTLRVAADQHYLSDVLLGAAVGTFSGVALPWMLHYGSFHAGARDLAKDHASVTWTFAPGPLGGSVIGTF